MTRKKRISTIIKDTYSQRYDLSGPTMVYAPVGTYRRGRGDRFAALRPVFEFLKSNRVMLFMAVFSGFTAILAVYYYNLLVDTQQNMFASVGNVNALMQRRSDIGTNLSKAVLDYSKHESSVFTAIVALRAEMQGKGFDKGVVGTLAKLPNEAKVVGSVATSTAAATDSAEVVKPGAETAEKSVSAGILPSLSGLMAIAEQYPDLKLSNNFESMMAAMVEVEKDLGTARVKFNATANIYTTNIAKFPCNFFAKIFGFKSYDYFTANQAAQEFKVIGF